VWYQAECQQLVDTGAIFQRIVVTVNVLTRRFTYYQYGDTRYNKNIAYLTVDTMVIN